MSKKNKGGRPRNAKPIQRLAIQATPEEFEVIKKFTGTDQRATILLAAVKAFDEAVREYFPAGHAGGQYEARTAVTAQIRPITGQGEGHD